MSADSDQPPPPGPARRARRVLRGVAVLAATLVVLDLALALTVLRGGNLRGHPLPPYEPLMTPAQEAWAERLGEPPEEGRIGRFDAQLGWDWVPSSRSGDGRFTINADGARGPREYPPEPPASGLRIVSFGDSFTFGDEIPDDKTFQAQLEERRPGLEVLNFGVGGYGTDQALLRFRRIGLRGARVVFVGILLENIGRNVNRYRPLWTPRSGFAATKPRFVLELGALMLVPQPYATPEALRGALLDGTLFATIAEHEHWLDRPHIPTGRWSALGRLAGLVRSHRARSPERLWSAPDEEPFQVTVELLAAFRREALAAGAEAAPVLLFPAETDLLGLRDSGRRYWQPLLDELERRGITTLDLSVPLAAAQERIDAGSWQAGLYYGSHLSGAGNHVVANALEDWLVAEGRLSAR